MKSPATDKNTRLEELVEEQLELLGEDPEREGLRRTPHRVARSLRFLTAGYAADVEKLLNGAVFEAPGSEMVIVKDIEFYSLCEHHMLPFFGRVQIGYIPDGHILGLSKFARLVDAFARRLQVQERLTTQLADQIMESLEPLGVGVVVEASHLCMMMRGVEKQGGTTVTSAMRGTFTADARTRQEFLAALRT
ncbi:MAG TPA: GTP cyclohydrolase I FolE [Deinococcales bacterium]|nr:GTP cyclohydrolase I FolE [Deinococcales bacterium]